MKNILFYQTSPEYGGVRRVTDILTRELQSRGYRVYWLFGHKFYNDNRDQSKQVECSFLPSNDIENIDNVRFYLSYLRGHKIDVIINQDALYGSINLINGHTPESVKIISVIHNNPTTNLQWLWEDITALRNSSFKERIKRIARILLFRKIKRQLQHSIRSHFEQLDSNRNTICLLSKQYISSLRNVRDNFSNNIVAIANPNTYTNIRTIPKEKIVLYVGRLDIRSKKVQLLISIWRTILNHITDWRLIIVGEGPDSKILKQMAKDIHSIEFAGFQDPRPFYEKASILCMTSIFEGFPMTLTEGMQHGCVPIAYNSFPAIQDIITNEVDGLLIEPFNRKEYGRKLIQLITNNKLRNELSKNAQSSVQRYDISKIIDQWVTLIESTQN